MNNIIDEINETQAFVWRWVGMGAVDHRNGQFPHYSYGRWAELLGYDGVSSMVRENRPETFQLLKSIRGPHGYAIYKMLVIKCQKQ